MSPTIILVPFLLAFLTFIIRFYFREGASSLANPSFLLAVATIALALVYLTLSITAMLPPYPTLGFGLAGLALLSIGVVRLFKL